MKYRIWVIAMGYYLQDEFDSFGKALSKARDTSFECRIDLGDKPMYHVSIFSEGYL